MEWDTGVHKSFRVDFVAIRELCRESGIEVPENPNKVFTFVLRDVGAIAEREKVNKEEKAAVVARDLAVTERDTARAEDVKLQAAVDASAQRCDALEDRVLRLTVDRELLSRKLAAACVAKEGQVTANAEVLRVEGARNEVEDKY